MKKIEEMIRERDKKYTTRKTTYCGGCENSRYRLPIAARFWPADIHEIYCTGQLACHNTSSILRRTTAAGHAIGLM